MANSILVTRSSMPEFDEYMDEIKPMWQSHWLTNMGPEHKSLQQQLIEYMGVENIDLFTNGHMSLELTLQAMNLQERLSQHRLLLHQQLMQLLEMDLHLYFVT